MLEHPLALKGTFERIGSVTLIGWNCEPGRYTVSLIPKTLGCLNSGAEIQVGKALGRNKFNLCDLLPSPVSSKWGLRYQPHLQNRAGGTLPRKRGKRMEGNQQPSPIALASNATASNPGNVQEDKAGDDQVVDDDLPDGAGGCDL